MARQKGIIKLEGTVGDVSFYKSKDGYLAREKGGVDGNRIKNDPAFQRTRENGSEFGRAGKAGRVLRNAFRILLQNASDSKVTSRLTKEMLRVIKSDTANGRGERVVTAGNLSILSGFDFNIDGKLGATVYAPFDASIDRAAGDYALSIPDFVPRDSIAYPAGATHFKILLGAAEVDFENETFNFGKVESAELPLGNQVQPQVDLTLNLNADSTLDLFLVLGIDFLQEVNGTMYSLNSGSHNPLTLVELEQAP